jgi:hypothetical protein
MRKEPPKTTYGPTTGLESSGRTVSSCRRFKPPKAKSVPLFEDWRSRPATSGWLCMRASAPMTPTLARTCRNWLTTWRLR